MSACVSDESERGKSEAKRGVIAIRTCGVREIGCAICVRAMIKIELALSAILSAIIARNII